MKKPLEITKQSSSTCNISICFPLTFNTNERSVGIPLIDLTSQNAEKTINFKL
jgi:hypothetical protein